MSGEPTDARSEPGPADAPDAADPVVGRRLAERYRVAALLARGGMARVYRARDERLERDVAVKVLSAPFADDPNFVEAFLGEARAAASLSHPNLVHVYDSGSDGAIHFIVMELLDGHRSLRELLDERGRLGVAEAVRVARELLAGLRLIHDRALVHCDVKSGNVMLGPGPAKLIDFGISRPPDVPAETARSIGSVRSMAPEQLRGEALTPATDLFAVGVVLYEALTGAMPYGGDTPEEIMAAHQAEDVRPPSTRAEGIPTRLDAAILQALRVDPSSRFHSAAALDRALEASIAAGDDEETKTSVVADAIDDGYVPPPVPAPARRPEPAPRASREPARRAAARRRRPVVGIVGTALVLAMAVLVGLLVIVPLLRLGGGAGDPPAASATPAATATAPTRTVEVPRTIGMSKDEAIAAATAAGLNWTIQCAQDPQQPEGIIDQEPPAGTPVAPGSRFTMYSARIRDCR